jgi:hypothetical protein
MYAKTHAENPLTLDQHGAEVEKITKAVDTFATEMKRRLVAKLDQGWRGWDDPTNGPEIYNSMLAHGIAVQMARGQEPDIANFAMFLWHHRTAFDRERGR